MKCRVCKSTKLTRYLDLGEVPLANSLLDNPQDGERLYPLKVMRCEECSLSQLSHVVNPKLMYTSYFYHSSISNTFKKHCSDMAKHLLEHFYPLQDQGDKRPEVLDIASNDSCLLNEFDRVGYFCTGVEPASNLTRCNPDIHVVRDFWSEKLVKSYGWKKDFIIATNVLAHVDDLHDFLRGVRYALSPMGMFVVEVPYAVNLLEKNQFDTIYHEHLSYFLLTPLMQAYRECGLHIFHIEQYPIHGGNIRIYASGYEYPRFKTIKHVLTVEDQKGMLMHEAYDQLADRVYKIKEDLYILLRQLHEAGAKVMGYGASAKGISLLNYSSIKREWIHSIVDDTPDKQGKFTPGTRIPIVDFSHFNKEKPNYVLLLAWNFAPELIGYTKHLGAKYIIPIPEVRIL